MLLLPMPGRRFPLAVCVTRRPVLDGRSVRVTRRPRIDPILLAVLPVPGRRFPLAGAGDEGDRILLPLPGR